jgi:diguanylate cyclase (GGDEF)-like protein/putative nucleotidyltransferase with HDIG domain
MDPTGGRPGSAAERVFVRSVSAIGLSVFLYAVITVALNPIDTQWLLLGLVTVLVVSRLDLHIPKTSGTITVSDTLTFTSLFLFGVLPSVVLAGVDAAVCSLHYKNRRKVVPFNTAVMSLSIYLAGLVVTELFGDLRKLSSDWPKLLMAAGCLALIHYSINSGIVGLVNALRQTRDRMKTWKEYVLYTSISYFAGAAAACLIVKLIAVISFYAFIIAVPILASIYLTYKAYLDKVDSSVKHAEQMSDLHLRTIEALAIAIDAKDEVTHDHVRRVQIYATGLARLFGLTDPEIEALRAGALLHDIGKLAVPDYILNKPGPLTPAEFEKMKVHTIVGAEILERVGFPYPVVPVVRHHHERWDGRGYPDGLIGDQIPMTARILTVSDCFDAVREDRQYRKAMTREQAVALLKQESGAIFDPDVVRAFLDHLTEFESEIRLQQVDMQQIQNRHEQIPVRQPAAGELGKKAFERIRSAHREVITLYDIAQTIVTSLDLRDTFAVFSSRLEDIVSYTTCVLYLLKHNSTDIEVAHVNGRNSEKLKGRRIASGAGITGWVVANRHPMYNCDPRLDFDALKAEIDEPYRTATVVPLLRDGEVLGALALYSTELNSYEPDHLRLVEAVAKLASDAIANAVRHELSEASALTDPITGLPNARALRHRFEEEADRARRHRDSFAVVMMDLDGFKSVNDRMGHQAGDQTLREVGALISLQVRSSDFVGRYAGDEFVAILQVGPDEAGDLVKRIQAAVDKHDFGIAGSTVAVGISVGWACFGVDGHTFDELLIGADRSMYADKARRKSAISPPGQSAKLHHDYNRIM